MKLLVLRSAVGGLPPKQTFQYIVVLGLICKKHLAWFTRSGEMVKYWWLMSLQGKLDDFDSLGEHSQSLIFELPAKTVEGYLACQWIRDAAFLCLPRDRQ